MSVTKKYKLFSVSGDGGRTPCAFFASPAGCRNGDSCKFAHLKSEDSETVDRPREHRFSSEAGSVVSSESEPETECRPVKMEEENPFLPPGGTPKNEPPTKKNRRGKRSDDHLPFVNPKKKPKTTILPEPSTSTTVSSATSKKDHQIADPKKKQSNNGTKKEQTTDPKTKQSNNDTIPSFRSLNLPIAAFSIPTTTAKKEADTTKASNRQNSEDAESSGETSDRESSSKRGTALAKCLPLPKSTPLGRKWLHAVELTRTHPQYASKYDFEKYKKIDEELGICSPVGWVKAKPFGAWCKDLPQSIAIDCEMCETQDPVSGKKNHKALCRISIVDAETKETLLDSLVKPAWPVTDYRTWINGIKEEDLENVQFTIRHAQAFMLALCSEETVITGHAVYNDLAAMNMEHHCVADSVKLFKAKGSDTAAVSLRDLAISILKIEMPAVHDSVNDAKTALLCLEYYLEKDGKVEPVERTVTASNKKDPNAKSFSFYASQLFVHRIPKNVDESHLSKMLLAHTDVQPSGVEKIVFSQSHGRTHVTFQSPEHATLAFETLQGKAESDPSGRLQKKIFLRNGSYVRIRKMAFEHKDKTENKDWAVARRLSS